MLNFNNNLTLTLSVNIILLIVIVKVLVHCIGDDFWRKKRAYRYFMFWAGAEATHIFFHSVFKLLFFYGNNQSLVCILAGFVILSDMVAFAFYGRWIVGVCVEMMEIRKRFELLSLFIPIGIGLAFFIPTALGIPDYFQLFLGGVNKVVYAYCILSFLCVALCVTFVLHVKKSLGSRKTLLFCLLVILPYVLSLQTIWRDTPVNIASSMMILSLYLSEWEKRKGILYEQEKQLAEKNVMLSEAKIEIMQSQIKPHFIYNSLSAIAALCIIDPQKAKAVTLDFSEYLRGNLYGIKETHTVPLAKELEHVHAYLNIEKARFGDNLRVEFMLNDTDFRLPMLTIQPIVENAVKHGVTKKVGEGKIKISTEKSENGHTIIVEDNGIGFEKEVFEIDKTKHLGLHNVSERVKTMCNGTLDIESKKGEGTRVVIFIPNN